MCKEPFARAGRRAEASQGSALELEGVGARRERQRQEQQEACSAPPPGEAVTWRWGNHDARRGASSPRREPSTHAAAHTARTTHRVPHACHASPFTQLSPPRTCPRGPPCAGGFRHPGLSAQCWDAGRDQPQCSLGVVKWKRSAVSIGPGNVPNAHYCFPADKMTRKKWRTARGHYLETPHGTSTNSKASLLSFC